MIIYTSFYVFSFFYKFLLYINISFVVISTLLIIIAKIVGNVTALKNKNIINITKNMLLFNILSNLLVASLLLYSFLIIYKAEISNIIIHYGRAIKIENNIHPLFYTFDLDIINILFYILALFVAFISLLALDTRLYSSKMIFIVLCNLLILIIFMFSFTNNYILFFIFYELLLIPSFFFVYRISPAKTAIQSSIFFVM